MADDIKFRSIEEIVLHLLSRRIADTRRVVAQERKYPGADPDKMDDIIRRGREELHQLEAIRVELETIFFGEAD